MARRVFFSFHYKPDNWRASQVRNIGKVEGNSPASDNDWEDVKKGGSDAIKKWIDEQMHGRSCIIVLVGSNTANRKWIDYEIEKAWDDKKGLVGIYVNKLKDANGNTSSKGANPFSDFKVGNTPLNKLVNCYTPAGTSSTATYDDIANNIEDWIEDAIESRQ